MRTRAIQLLILATILWGLSFPATKALDLAQTKLLGQADTWFFASLLCVYRFGIAAVGLLALSARTLSSFTRSEGKLGLGLGLFGGVGILLQVDGMSYTTASTSAFLTQATCLFIPLWLALRHGRRPTGPVLLSCALVLAGVAVLAKLDWRDLHLGRGEIETLAAAAFFSGQIIWLNRPQFKEARVNHFSLVMFMVIALVCLPVAVATTDRAADWVNAFHSPGAAACLAILVIPCTFGAYMMMNHFQRHVTPTEAGLIYCFEPLFASGFALFLPGIFSGWAGISYVNETLTTSLLIGGGLITIANIVVLKSPSEPSDASS